MEHCCVAVAMQGVLKPFCCDKDLLLLSSLCKLEVLKLDVSHPAYDPDTFPVNLSFLCGLSALKSLDLWCGKHVEKLHGLKCIAACTGLQGLALTWSRSKPSGQALLLDRADWEVLRKLTRLTTFEVWPVTVDSAMSIACCPALCQLTSLRGLSAEAWTPDVLSVLTCLPHLQRVGGGGLPGDVPAGTTCLQVIHLLSTYGAIPTVALPGLHTIDLNGGIAPCTLANLGTQCSSLKVLGLDRNEIDVAAIVSFTLEGGRPGDLDDAMLVEKLSAVRAATSLQQPTSLGFCPSSTPELLACVDTAAALCSHQLQCLKLVIMPAADVSMDCLVQLGRVHGLQELRLQLLGDEMWPERQHVMVFLCAVRSIRTVYVAVFDEEQVGLVNEGYETCVRLGFKVPPAFNVEVFGADLKAMHRQPLKHGLLVTEHCLKRVVLWRFLVTALCMSDDG